MKWLNHPKLLWCAFALVLCCLLLPSCYPPAYAETTYTITETELTALETRLNRLAENSKSKEESLKSLKTQLETAEKRLILLSESNKKTQESLKNAEASLNQYVQEQTRKQRIKDRQRKTWAVIACGALIWAGLK